VIYPTVFFTEVSSTIISHFFYTSAFVKTKVALGHVSFRIFRGFRVLTVYTAHILKCVKRLSVKRLGFV